MVTSYSHIVGEKNLLWAEVAELNLGRHEQSTNHHEGEHVEADVVIPLTLVQVASDHDEDEDADEDKGTPPLKKNVFFRALPKLPLPLPLFWATCTSFSAVKYKCIYCIF